ncbi:MAG: hypothetical protein DRI90_25740, partial [Deltaproteobacteria bacterium]
ALVLGVSGYRLWRLLVSTARFVMQHRRIVRAGRLWRRCPVGGRSVEVLITSSTAENSAMPSVPYTAGLLRPYVCFPTRAFEAMTDHEREAVLQHELAHVAHHHLAIRGVVELLASVFWFVPGIRFLACKVADDCEFAADDEATRKVEQIALASALVTIGGLLQVQADGPRTGYAIFAGESKPRLVSRVERLIAPAPAANNRQSRWGAPLWRLLLFLVTAQSILTMVVGNNA